MRAPQEVGIDGSGVVQRNINMNSKTLTNCGDISATHANGFMLENAASSTTNPTIIHDRATPTSGIGGVGASNACVIIGGVYKLATTSTTIDTGGNAILNGGGTSLTVGQNDDVIFEGADADRGGATLTHKLNAMSATLTAAGTHSFANAISAGATVVGVATRVTTTITGCTSISIGDETDDDRFGVLIALTAGTTTTNADWTITSTPVYAAATDIVITAVGGGASFTAGAMRVCVYYVAPTAPTS